MLRSGMTLKKAPFPCALKEESPQHACKLQINVPGAVWQLTICSEELEDEIADQFLSTRREVYHRPNRIVPSMKHEEPFGDILFQRGIALIVFPVIRY